MYIHNNNNARLEQPRLSESPNAQTTSKLAYTFPSVSFHRCRCVSVKCVERVLSVLEARVNVWLPDPQTC